MAMQQQAGRPPWRRDQVRRIVLKGLADGALRPYAPDLQSPRRRK
jgi:hypothetical protein